MEEDEYGDDYGDIADEDLIDAFSQPSQSLPPHSRSPHRRKRRRINEWSDDAVSHGSRRNSRDSIEYSGSGGEGKEAEKKSKKKKYRTFEGADKVEAPRILGATQAEALPDSSPAYKIRGAIYRKPRPEIPTPPVFAAAREPAPTLPNIFQRQVNRNLPSPISRTPQHASSNSKSTSRQTQTNKENDFAQELDDLPSDAFSSPEVTHGHDEPIIIGDSPVRNSQAPRRVLAAPQTGLRQTTLFGGRAPEEVSASQAKKVYNFKVDLPPEQPTHHKLDEEALKTWSYPTNLGTKRDYQYSIVKNGLFNNLLVALPTGLGKTFIAATIMLNFFRWTKDAQIVFVAPTKPLVAQQAEACFSIVGIPKSQTTMLTGEQTPALRAEEWAIKRVFFMTPQTLENDLRSGIADPKKIVLLVVDEAHRATGNYAYVKVVEFMRRFSKSFRILALTATPGSSVEAVQEVIDNLEISKVEIRIEESIDIQKYVHKTNIDQIILDPSDEIALIQEHYSKALQPLVDKLCSQKAYYNKDPMSLTAFGMVKARQTWMASAGKTANMGLKGMMNALFTVLGSVAHGIKLLNFHGIGPFYSKALDLRQGVEAAGSKGPKYPKQIIEHPEFKKMMDRMALWIRNEDFIGHPKLTYLCDTILNHFMDAGEGRLGEDSPPSATRVIVFSEYRDSAEDICRALNKHGPMIRASVFVGQADSKRSEGMNQLKQLETIGNFKNGKINVIVATSIGEEGLDIGQVDLIVCYDASASPIRMLQRMGRTGRKRAGKVVLLLMRGKEESQWAKAKDNYEAMQKMISAGTRFNFRHDLSVRIVPRTIDPTPHETFIEIPIENTQGPALPVPTRRANKTKKKPEKKFHMPDDVETGFRNASKLYGDGPVRSNLELTVKQSSGVAKSQLAAIPDLDAVLLTEAETNELEKRYQNIAGDDLQEVSMPDMTAQPIAQRSLSRIVKVRHGHYTKRSVKLFRTLARSQDIDNRYLRPYGDSEPSRDYLDPPSLVDEANENPMPRPKKAVAPKAKPAQRPKNIFVMSDIVCGNEKSSQPTLLNSDGPELTPAADSEGEGDDLADSEEMSDDGDIDPSSSLLNFIAEDEDDIRQRRPLTKSSSPPPPVAPARKSLLDPITYSLDSSDAEMPDITDLVEARAGLGQEIDDELNSDEDVLPKAGHRVKRRVVVEDDESDE